MGFTIENAGGRIVDEESQGITFRNLTQLFSDVGDAVIDQHIRNQREKAEYMNAHEGETSSPEEAHETPHRNSAQSLIINFLDGRQEIIHTHHPVVEQGGWTFRTLNGVPYLVIGHGVPRRQFPLCNILSFDLSEDIL